MTPDQRDMAAQSGRLYAEAVALSACCETSCGILRIGTSFYADSLKAQAFALDRASRSINGESA